MGKTLYEHAAYELRKLGELSTGSEADKKIFTSVLALVRRYEKQTHDDYTGKWVLEFFDTLCNFQPLSPITDDPDEWEGYEDTRKNMRTGETEVTKRWQSLRCPSMISSDGGKTWFDLKTNKEGTSVDHLEQAKDWAKQKADAIAEKDKANTIETAPAPAAPDTTPPAGEEVPVAPATDEAGNEATNSEEQAAAEENKEAN